MNATEEKNQAALLSLISAVCLTFFKIIVGVFTGSLGILAEATHSGFDLIAALVSLFAVNESSKPADEEHLYGHYKIENLAALFECFLLMFTSGVIIHAAVMRLVEGESLIEVSIWAYVVMIVSIIIDYTRSNHLYKTAKKYNSQALEADALHFQTDIWSSLVVIVGLMCLTMSEWLGGIKALEQADAVAAIGVAVIIIWTSFRLTKKTLDGLLDSAPVGLETKIVTIVSGVAGVINCHNVRCRAAGPKIFADIHILVDGSQTLSEAHTLTDLIEKEINKQTTEEIDVTVHPEPA